MKRPINTNELRDLADKLPKRTRTYLHEVASELDFTRMERNQALGKVRELKAAAKTGARS